MGRQLSIVATPSDERRLLNFVRTLSPVRVYVAFSDTTEGLWVDDWEKRDIEGVVFSIWLQSFPWIPEYKQTGRGGCTSERAGLWYVSNGHSAPVLEVL